MKWSPRQVNTNGYDRCEPVSSTGRGAPTGPLAMELGNWLAGWLREHQLHDLELRRYAAPDQAVGGG